MTTLNIEKRIKQVVTPAMWEAIKENIDRGIWFSLTTFDNNETVSVSIDFKVGNIYYACSKFTTNIAFADSNELAKWLINVFEGITVSSL